MTTLTGCLSESVSASCKRRWDHLQKTRTPERRRKVRSICKDSPAYWINHYCLTYDPRFPQAVIPFDLFPKQAEFLTWLQEREQRQEDGLVEKSRDMGVTWLCCAYALHGWLFRPGFAVGFGSRKLELVDRRGDLDSIFEKIRFMLQRLPPWMMPSGFNFAEHDNLARIINPDNGASITGEGGDNIGRGGRKTLFFVDEAAFLEHPQLVDRALSQTTRCRIDCSTPNGPGNPFAEKRFSGRVSVFTLHWSSDPRKGPEWYESEKKKRDPVALAQEVDIDYSASIEGIVIPAAWVRAAVDLHVWAKEQGIEFPESGEEQAGLDIAEEGKNKSVFISRRGPLVRMPVDWGQVNISETAGRGRDAAQKAGAKVVKYDAGGPGVGVKEMWRNYEGGLPFRAVAILFGGSATDRRWPDGHTSHERFLNLRAEMYWSLRMRFEKAYEFREKGVQHAPNEMISIPHHPTLIAQLSQPLMQHTNTGKMKVEAKSDMAKRGVASPDFADALVLAMWEEKLYQLKAEHFFV